MRRSIVSAHSLSLNVSGGGKNVFDGGVSSGDQFSFPVYLPSCCLEQLDVPESIDVVMNVMSPVVLWNMVVSVVVVSLCGLGFTMMVVLPR